MALQQVLNRLHRQLWVVFIPVILDIISLGAGWLFIGFPGESRLSSRIILEMGMPSLSHLLNTPLLANQLGFMNQPGTPTYAWIAVVPIMLASTFAQGGFISVLKGIAEGGEVTFARFIRDGRSNWIRFIWFYVMVMLAKIAVTALLVLLFGVAGALASLLLFIVFRIMYTYLEFTIVADAMSIDQTLRMSREYLKDSLAKTIPAVIVMFLFSSAVSVLIHWIWLPVAFIAGIFVYAYLMTVIQLILMAIMCEIRQLQK